jgi:hypothetical protein
MSRRRERIFWIFLLIVIAAFGLELLYTVSNHAFTSPSVVADFICRMDSPGDGGQYTLTISNPGTATIEVGNVQIDFYDANGSLIDTDTDTPELSILPNQYIVTTGAEELSAAPYTCRETSWSQNG